MKFRSKPVYTYVEAVLFQNDEQSNLEVSELLGDSLLDSSVEDNTLTLSLKNGDEKKELEVPFGYFLVRNEEGIFSVEDPESFTEEYSLYK